jgi:predicted amidohydrolase YtcJ
MQMRTTLAIINGKIWTGNRNRPLAEALAVSEDRIIAIGNTYEIKQLIHNETDIIDAKGLFVIPGFTDSHLHFLEGGIHMTSVQLRDARSPQEFTARIAAFVKQVPVGTWITGGDWDHENWGGELPSRQWIDTITQQHPVWLSRLDGHMALANTLALQLAGFTEDIPEPEGGMVIRDDYGNPTGVFKDTAMSIISRAIPAPDEKRQQIALTSAMKFIASFGITSVHHHSLYDNLNSIPFEKAWEEQSLITRIYVTHPLPAHEELSELIRKRGRGDKWLKFGGVKGFVDGSLGSHTAAFFEPYFDTPDYKGLFVTDPEDLYFWCSQADLNGLQVIVHAIGDRAINTQLNIYERIIKENGKRDRRFRIEHAQHIASEDIPRFAQLDVIASMQPYHVIDDGRWSERIIGKERLKTTFALNSLLKHGTQLIFGSDWFVAPPNPLLGIYAAVTRSTLDGKYPEGLIPEEKITVTEALNAYTIAPAYASFEEHLKGSLEPGKLADIVILDQDITEISPTEIQYVKVSKTIVDGKIVYQKS